MRERMEASKKTAEICRLGRRDWRTRHAAGRGCLGGNGFPCPGRAQHGLDCAQVIELADSNTRKNAAAARTRWGRVAGCSRDAGHARYGAESAGDWCSSIEAVFLEIIPGGRSLGDLSGASQFRSSYMLGVSGSRRWMEEVLQR